MVLDRHARTACLCRALLVVAGLVNVYAQTPLPLPADPETACSPEVTRQWSREYPSCPRSILGNTVIYNTPQIDPDEECCAGTLRYFGSDSTLPSRNCFCDPTVYARFTAGKTMVPINTYFGVCTMKGFPIPVYEMGTGACSGAPYNTTGLFSTAVFETTEPEVPLKSTREWLSDLRQDGLVLTAFIIGIISAIGFGGALWIFFFNLVRSFSSNLLSKRVSKHR